MSGTVTATAWPEASAQRGRRAPHSVGPVPASGAPRVPQRSASRLGWCIAVVALLLDVAVCVPFVYDPLGWREPTFATPGGSGRAEYAVFLAEQGDAAGRARFFAEHPAIRVEHDGGWQGMIVVSLPSGARHLVASLRTQPFVRLMTRSGAVFCQ